MDVKRFNLLSQVAMRGLRDLGEEACLLRHRETVGAGTGFLMHLLLRIDEIRKIL